MVNSRHIRSYMSVCALGLSLGSISQCEASEIVNSFNDVISIDNGYQQTQRVKAHQLARFLLHSYVDRVSPALRINKHEAVETKRSRHLKMEFQFDLAVHGTDYRFKYKGGYLRFSPRSVPSYMGESVGSIYTFVGFRMKW